MGMRTVFSSRDSNAPDKAHARNPDQERASALFAGRRRLPRPGSRKAARPQMVRVPPFYWKDGKVLHHCRCMEFRPTLEPAFVHRSQRGRQRPPWPSRLTASAPIMSRSGFTSPRCRIILAVRRSWKPPSADSG